MLTKAKHILQEKGHVEHYPTGFSLTEAEDDVEPKQYRFRKFQRKKKKKKKQAPPTVYKAKRIPNGRAKEVTDMHVKLDKGRKKKKGQA